MPLPLQNVRWSESEMSFILLQILTAVEKRIFLVPRDVTIARTSDEILPFRSPSPQSPTLRRIIRIPIWCQVYMLLHSAIFLYYYHLYTATTVVSDEDPPSNICFRCLFYILSGIHEWIRNGFCFMYAVCENEKRKQCEALKEDVNEKDDRLNRATNT